MRKLDLVGRRFDKLTVVAEIGRNRFKHVIWLCQCSCGNHIARSTSNLTQGVFTGCKECEGISRAQSKTTHGRSDERLYGVWQTMRGRCFNSDDYHFRWYGAKGITVCQDWDNYPAFREWALSKGYRQGLTIERVNAGGNYEPSNCEWITQSENSRRSQISRKAAH